MTGFDNGGYRGARRRSAPPPEPEPVSPDEWQQFRPRGRRHKPASEQTGATPVVPPSAPPGQGGGRRGRGEPASVRRRRAEAETMPPPPRPRAEAPPSAPPPPYADDDTDAKLSALGFLPEEEHQAQPSAPPRRSPPRRKEAKAKARSARRTAKRGRRKGRLLAPLLALTTLLVIVGGGGAVGYLWLRGYFAPPDYEGEGHGEVVVVVEHDATGAEIGQMLVEEGVVASVQAFTNAARFESINDLHPGTYGLRAEMSAEAALDMLLDPDSRVGFQVTIREGLRLSQIFEEIANNTEVSQEELEALAERPEEELELPSYADDTIDGYLFPETYTFEPHVSAAEVLQRMLDRHERVATEIDFEDRAEEEGFDAHEMMAIAAIVQAETGTVADMPKISRVVYNRLDIGMQLGMDSTCFFVIDDYGIALSGEQLRECEDSGSEYATYGREGLPQGPIVNPGEDAMEAALDPEPGDWLFFVATNPEEGVTEFAETEEEFNELVRRFRETQETE